MPWPDEPCATCPRVARGLPLPCQAQVTGHRRFCELGDRDGPAYSPAYEAMLCGEQWPPVVVPQAPAEALAPETPNPHAERLALVQGCDYRTDALDECGCTARRHCSLRLGEFASEPFAVSLSRCLECVSERHSSLP